MSIRQLGMRQVRLRRLGDPLTASAFALTVIAPAGAGVDAGPRINAALAANPAGVLLLPGIHEIATQIVPSFFGQSIRGCGRGYVTELRIRTSAALSSAINVTNSYATELADFTMTWTTAPTSGDAILLAGAANFMPIGTTPPATGFMSNYLIRDVEMIGCFNGIHITDGPGPVGGFGISLEDLYLVPTNGGSAIWVNSPHGAEISIVNIRVNSRVPVDSSQGFAAIRVSSIGDVVIDNANTFECRYSIIFDPSSASQFINCALIKGCVLDSPMDNAINMTGSGGGTVAHVAIEGTWCAGARATGGGTDTGNCILIGSGCSAIKVDTSEIYDASGSKYCVLVNGTATRIEVTHNFLGGGGGGIGCKGTGASVVRIQDNNIGLGTLGVGDTTSTGIDIDATTSTVYGGGNSIHATTPLSGAFNTLLYPNIIY